NQDEPSMYHLFYADYKGTPGTDITFFEIGQSSKYQAGTNSISRTVFRVPSLEALEYFKERFQEKGIYTEGTIERFGYTYMNFSDYETQRLALIVDPEYDESEPFAGADISEEFAITGIKAVKFSADSIFITDNRTSHMEKEGCGSDHHFSLRVSDEAELEKVLETVNAEKWRNSGIVDRFYFKAGYIKAVGNITVEISTEEPG